MCFLDHSTCRLLDRGVWMIPPSCNLADISHHRLRLQHYCRSSAWSSHCQGPQGGDTSVLGGGDDIRYTLNLYTRVWDILSYIKAILTHLIDITHCCMPCLFVCSLCYSSTGEQKCCPQSLSCDRQGKESRRTRLQDLECLCRCLPGMLLIVGRKKISWERRLNFISKDCS